MDALPGEDFSSNTPNERRELGGTLPSQELLNDLMRGPRKLAQFFDDSISIQPKASELTKNKIEGELNSYPLWLAEHLKPITKEYQSLVLASPENVPKRSELSFHTINQFIMPQWHRVLVSPKYPKMDSVDLETAQIFIAMESMKIMSARNQFEGPQDLFDNELYDFDTMLNLLQLSIDTENRNQPSVIAVPHPKADFLIFELTEDGTFNKRVVQSSKILDPSLKPGSVAAELLQKLRVSSVSRRPEFQEKSVLHKLFLSRETAKSSYERK